MTNKIYDLIIIGAGPAGLTAAIYASRRALSNLVLTKNIGGQITTVPEIENYPGRETMTGLNLANDLKNQAEKFGAEIKFEEIEKIEKTKSESNNLEHFIINAKSGNKYEALTVILAFGKTPRSLGVTGEKKFAGKGVGYCANCDMPLFKGKDIAVIGGGSSALDAAIYGSDIARKVYLVHRRDEFRGEEVLLQRAKSKSNIEFILDAVVTEIEGGKFVEGIKIKNLKTDKEKTLPVQGIFVEIGFEVKRDFIEKIVNLDQYGQVIIDSSCRASIPGIFAAGDITDTPFKQIPVATGEGAKAALAVYEYIQKLKGMGSLKVDWGKHKKGRED